MKIVFVTPQGVSIVSPAPEFVEAVGFDAIAAKDVPYNVPYYLIEDSDIPSDLTGWKPQGKPAGKGANYGVGGKHDFLGWTETGEVVISDEE